MMRACSTGSARCPWKNEPRRDCNMNAIPGKNPPASGPGQQRTQKTPPGPSRQTLFSGPDTNVRTSQQKFPSSSPIGQDSHQLSRPKKGGMNPPCADICPARSDYPPTAQSNQSEQTGTEQKDCPGDGGGSGERGCNGHAVAVAGIRSGADPLGNLQIAAFVVPFPMPLPSPFISPAIFDTPQSFSRPSEQNSAYLLVNPGTE